MQISLLTNHQPIPFQRKVWLEVQWQPVYLGYELPAQLVALETTPAWLVAPPLHDILRHGRPTLGWGLLRHSHCASLSATVTKIILICFIMMAIHKTNGPSSFSENSKVMYYNMILNNVAAEKYELYYAQNCSFKIT